MKPTLTDVLEDENQYHDFKAERADEITDAAKDVILGLIDTDQFYEILERLAEPQIEILAAKLAEDAAVDADIDEYKAECNR